MTIEKVNGIKSAITSFKPAFKGEEEQEFVEKPSDSSKNVVTALSILAAIGAAGVAIYKHKNAKDAIKKAEDEAQKKIAEAEEKAKKAAEDVEKKIQEAVDNAKKEFSETKTPEVPKSEPTESITDTGVPTDTEIKTPKSGKKKKSDTKDDSKSITDKITDFAKEKFSKLKSLFKREKTTTKSTETPPASTKTETKVKKPRIWSRTTESSSEVKKPEVTETTKKKKFSFDGIKEKAGNIYQNTKEYFYKKYTGITTFFERMIKKYKLRKYNKAAQKGIEYLDKEARNKEAEKIASDRINDLWLEKQHKIKEKEYEKLFEEYFDKQFKEAAEEDLLKEYAALKDVVKGMPVTDYKAQRFLEIQAELMNHRGYIFNKDGKLVKSTRWYFDESAKKGLRQLELEEDAARYAKRASDAKNANWLSEQHKIKEKDYQKLFEKHFDEELKNTSELNLLIEYNILKKDIKNLPVTDPKALRFLEIQGELTNHRGFKVYPDGKIRKASPKKNNENTMLGRIKRFFGF